MSKAVLSAPSLISVLRRFIDQISDVRCLVISTAEGVELLSVAKVSSVEDSQMVAMNVHSYVISCEQASRLELGSVKYAMTWLANSVLVQMRVESLVVSVLCDDRANLGVLEDNMKPLKDILGPVCLGFSNE